MTTEAVILSLLFLGCIIGVFAWAMYAADEEGEREE